jgi:hypothetical protein
MGAGTASDDGAEPTATLPTVVAGGFTEIVTASSDGVELGTVVGDVEGICEGLLLGVDMTGATVGSLVGALVAGAKVGVFVGDFVTVACVGTMVGGGVMETVTASPEGVVHRHGTAVYLIISLRQKSSEMATGFFTISFQVSQLFFHSTPSYTNSTTPDGN